MDKRRILDNRNGRVLQTVFEEYCGDTRELKIAVGYFYVSGFDLVKNYLKDIPKIFLVIGTETDVPTEKEITLGYVEKEIQDDINTIADPAKIDALDELHQYIQSGRIEVRVYTKSRFHAQAYIFKREAKDSDVAVIGSSNFTRQGLGGEAGSNTELNSRHTEQTTVDELDGWFANIWDESEPYQEGMLRLIENSPPFIGRRKKDPHFVSPTELFKAIFLEHVGQIRPKPESILTMFQQVGVHNAHQKIQRYNGCMICDSVGLGKTFIGLGLIRDAQRQGAAVLLIVPAHIKSNWESEIARNFPGINLDENNLKIISISELGRYDLRTGHELERLRATYSFIVIDEAHRLRTRGTFDDTERSYIGNKTYANLKFLQKSDTKFVLLTATPINNSVNDAKNQLEIFTSPKVVQNYDTSIDASCFDDYKQSNDAIKNLQRIEREMGEDKSREINDERIRQRGSLEDIRKILEEVMILRTRTTVLKEYPDAKIGGHKIMTEMPRIRAEKYKTGTEYSDLYDDVSRAISDLRLPHITMINPGSQGQNISGLYRVHLFKRLESSIYALVRSLSNLKDKEKALMDEIGKQGLEGAIRHLREVHDNAFLEELEDVPETAATRTDRIDVDENELVDAIKSDLSIIDQLVSSRIDPLRQSERSFVDPKLDNLRSLLCQHNGKVIIFCQYADTAEYLHGHVQLLESANGRSVDCVVGDPQRNVGSGLDTSEKIGRFAPKANHWNVKPADEIDILITTDKLAEGVNLQDSSRIVNYDLPWNPMRIVQRIGRVDRIGSKSRTVVHNMLPDAGLDRFLGLLEKVSLKIHNIADIIGKEAQILSDNEVVNPRSIGIKIRSLQETEQYEEYEIKSNGKLLSGFKAGEYGKESMDLYNVVAMHNISSFEQKSLGVYSLLNAGVTPRAFAMFRVYDSHSGQKIDNVIISKEIASNKFVAMPINDPLILDMPDMPAASYDGHLIKNLDMAICEIESYFSENRLSEIKNKFYQSMMKQVTNDIPKLQKVLLDRLESTTVNQQIHSTLTEGLAESGNLLYNFLVENCLTRDDARHLKKEFGTKDWYAKMMEMKIAELIQEVFGIYQRRWKDRPVYRKSFAKDNVASTVVCKGVWV